ncbi:hypothetical protein [Vreelandella venusta]|uniref:hypothetical protein n=1 Tax=Vreelandella venusta TaxID=44935 RepID=UPI00116ED5FC|nr:hypothetical protein [Halomonas venusta]GEK52383.1 hypothetical protein HVE01_31040 [Halomonas venusta]
MKQSSLQLVGALNEAQKDAVVHYYITGGKTVSQSWIANHFGVHRKTIYNVLKERGVLLTKQDRTKLMGVAQVMKELDLTPEKVRALAKPIDPDAVVKHMMGMDADKLSAFLYQIIGAHHMQEAMASQVMKHAS